MVSLMSHLPEMDGRRWLLMTASSSASSTSSIGDVLQVNFHLWLSL